VRNLHVTKYFTNMQIFSTLLNFVMWKILYVTKFSKKMEKLYVTKAWLQKLPFQKENNSCKKMEKLYVTKFSNCNKIINCTVRYKTSIEFTVLVSQKNSFSIFLHWYKKKINSHHNPPTVPFFFSFFKIIISLEYFVFLKVL
jgi:hypothetical protein